MKKYLLNAAKSIQLLDLLKIKNNQLISLSRRFATTKKKKELITEKFDDRAESLNKNEPTTIRSNNNFDLEKNDALGFKESKKKNSTKKILGDEKQSEKKVKVKKKPVFGELQPDKSETMKTKKTKLRKSVSDVQIDSSITLKSNKKKDLGKIEVPDMDNSLSEDIQKKKPKKLITKNLSDKTLNNQKKKKKKIDEMEHSNIKDNFVIKNTKKVNQSLTTEAETKSNEKLVSESAVTSQEDIEKKNNELNNYNVSSEPANNEPKCNNTAKLEKILESAILESYGSSVFEENSTYNRTVKEQKFEEPPFVEQINAALHKKIIDEKGFSLETDTRNSQNTSYNKFLETSDIKAPENVVRSFHSQAEINTIVDQSVVKNTSNFANTTIKGGEKLCLEATSETLPTEIIKDSISYSAKDVKDGNECSTINKSIFSLNHEAKNNSKGVDEMKLQENFTDTFNMKKIIEAGESKEIKQDLNQNYIETDQKPSGRSESSTVGEKKYLKLTENSKTIEKNFDINSNFQISKVQVDSLIDTAENKPPFVSSPSINKNSTSDVIPVYEEDSRISLTENSFFGKDAATVEKNIEEEIQKPVILERQILEYNYLKEGKINSSLEKEVVLVKLLIDKEVKKNNPTLLPALVSKLEAKPDLLINSLTLTDFMKIWDAFFDNNGFEIFYVHETLSLFKKLLRLMKNIEVPNKLLFSVLKHISLKVEKVYTIHTQFSEFDAFLQTAKRVKLINPDKFKKVRIPVTTSWEKKASAMKELFKELLPFFMKENILRDKIFQTELMKIFSLFKDLEGFIELKKYYRKKDIPIPMQLHADAIQLSGEIGTFEYTTTLFLTASTQYFKHFKIYLSFVHALANLGMKEKAFEFIKTNMSKRGFEIGILVYDTLLKGFLNSKNYYEEALELFSDLHFETFLPKPRHETYIIMLNGALNNYDLVTVQKICAKLEKNVINRQSTLFLYTLNKMTEEAIEFIEIQKRKGSTPNTVAVGILIEVLIEKGKTMEALKLFKSLIYPLRNEKVFFVFEDLLNALHLQGGNFTEIFDLSKGYINARQNRKPSAKEAKIVIESFLSQTVQKPLTLKEYHILLSYCISLKSNILQTVCKIVDLMQVKPNIETFKAVNKYLVAVKDKSAQTTWRAKLRDAGVFDFDLLPSLKLDSQKPQDRFQDNLQSMDLVKGRSEVIKEVLNKGNRKEAFALESDCKNSAIPISYTARLRLMEASGQERNFADTDARIQSELSYIDALRNTEPQAATNLKIELLNAACRAYCLGEEIAIAKDYFYKLPIGTVHHLTLEMFFKKCENDEDQQFLHHLIESWNSLYIKSGSLLVYNIWFKYLQNESSFNIAESLRVFGLLKTQKAKLEPNDYLLILRCIGDSNFENITNEEMLKRESAMKELFFECARQELLTIKHFNAILKYCYRLGDFNKLHKYYLLLRERVDCFDNSKNVIKFDSESLIYIVRALVSLKKDGYLEALAQVKKKYSGSYSKLHFEPILTGSLNSNSPNTDKKGDLRVALEVISLMKDNGLLESKHLALLIENFFNSDKAELAFDVYDNLEAYYNVKRDTLLDNTMIRGYLNLGDLYEARKIYNDMSTVSNNENTLSKNCNKPLRNLETYKLFIDFLNLKKKSNEISKYLDATMASCESDGFKLI
ncbi:hypothetical protein HDU92_002232 [Lobulomyces angularis]|nr:hypothetical protein HDU92_002232 [Lobulomyces angularis]